MAREICYVRGLSYNFLNVVISGKRIQPDAVPSLLRACQKYATLVSHITCNYVALHPLSG
jgi:hypothetical protein